jgi:hypothetical protein
MTITVTTGLPIGAAEDGAGFTYSSLCSYIDTWLARTDCTEQAPFFISMFEDYLNYGGDIDPPLRCREMEVVTEITPDDDLVCLLPDDFLEYRKVVELASIRRPLDYITDEQSEQLYPVRNTGGLPCHFSIVGEYLYPLPVTSNDIELTYYQKIPALTETNTTNWLLENNKSIYFRGALMMAADYIKDEAEFAKQSQFVRALVAGMNRTDVIARYNRAAVKLRGPTP